MSKSDEPTALTAQSIEKALNKVTEMIGRGNEAPDLAWAPKSYWKKLRAEKPDAEIIPDLQALLDDDTFPDTKIIGVALGIVFK